MQCIYMHLSALYIIYTCSAVYDYIDMHAMTNPIDTYYLIQSHYVDPLSSYPTLEQLSQLECDQWLQLGVCLGLGNDQMETIKKSQHPTAVTLQAAKINNIDMQWKDIVEALVSIGEYKLAESVCTQQGQL